MSECDTDDNSYIDGRKCVECPKTMKKNILITGASRGLGKALAEVFAEHEYNLILHSKQSSLPCVKKSFNFVREHTKDYHVECETVHGDITDTRTAYKLKKEAEEMGGLDVLILNAGIHESVDLEESDSGDYANMINTNLTSQMVLTRELWQQVKRREGLIVFINSIAGKVGADKEFMYCAAKHGLKGFADSIQFDATRAGIKVVSVYLGAIQTDMTKHRGDYEKLMNVKDASNFIYHTCKNYDSMRVTEIDVCRRVY
jgi:short-subunit dehydrogenase